MPDNLGQDGIRSVMLGSLCNLASLDRCGDRNPGMLTVLGQDETISAIPLTMSLFSFDLSIDSSDPSFLGVSHNMLLSTGQYSN